LDWTIVACPARHASHRPYDNDVGFGQSRILLVWNRLIFPDGRSIVLERQPGADAEGYAGVQDGVDYHWWDLAKAAGLSTLLNVGAELGQSGEALRLRYAGRHADPVRPFRQPRPAHCSPFHVSSRLA